MANKITTEYIQFSKKVTGWGITLTTCMLAICIAVIAIFNINPEIAVTISHLYSAYVTIMGITIGTYQGNSSLEKWSKARYNFTEILKQGQEKKEMKEQEEEESLG